MYFQIVVYTSSHSPSSPAPLDVATGSPTDIADCHRISEPVFSRVFQISKPYVADHLIWTTGKWVYPVGWYFI